MAIDISNYLKEATKEFSKDNIKEFSANSIAEKVELSRSTVSSYLNKEVKQGRIIKIKEYPVIFYIKKLSLNYILPQHRLNIIL